MTHTDVPEHWQLVWLDPVAPRVTFDGRKVVTKVFFVTIFQLGTHLKIRLSYTVFLNQLY